MSEQSSLSYEDKFNWDRHPCLVTGGAGFGGAHLCSALLERNAELFVIDRIVPRNSYFRLTGLDRKANIFNVDIRDSESILLILERFQIRTVFHLAAQPIVPISVVSPFETFSINVMGTIALLEAVRRSTYTRNFILASSGAYYGTTHSVQPITEDSPPLISANLYSPSKAAADIAARCYSETYKINVGVCRFINTYGPGDVNFNRLVPRAIRNLINNEPYDFGDRDDGTTALDYMHISDMTNAYLATAEHITAYSGQAFNFGTGAIHTTRQVVEAVSLAFDGKMRISNFHGSAHSIPVKKQLDVDRSKTNLGWVAKYNLHDGIKNTMDWYKKNWGLI